MDWWMELGDVVVQHRRDGEPFFLCIDSYARVGSVVPSFVGGTIGMRSPRMACSSLPSWHARRRLSWQRLEAEVASCVSTCFVMEHDLET